MGVMGAKGFNAINGLTVDVAKMDTRY